MQFRAVVAMVFRAYQLLVLASVVMSWVNPNPYNPVVRFIRQMTDPLFDGVRRLVPFLRAGMIDFTPIVVMLGIDVVAKLVDGLLLAIQDRL